MLNKSALAFQLEVSTVPGESIARLGITLYARDVNSLYRNHHVEMKIALEKKG
jgi:hypothetical protein